MRDFFISYSSKDSAWAEWIAWQLEDAGYTTFVQAWDFGPGQSFVERMQQGAAETERTIAVLSPNYLASEFTQPEWGAAFAKDPTGKKGKLLPIRVQRCDLEGLLGPIMYLDLVDKDEASAKAALLRGLLRDRGARRPSSPPPFPGQEGASPGSAPSFPGATPARLPERIRRPTPSPAVPPGVNRVVQPTPEDVAALIQEKTSILAVIGKCVATGTTVAAGLRQALDAGAAVVQSDLENLRPAKMEESGKEFYFALASTLARQLHLPRSLREVWDEDLPGAANMHAFMRDEVLASARGHVVCVLNNVDMLLPCAFGNDVFGLIRAWHNSRPTDPAGNWEQLTVVLMCHSDPSRFITDQYQSPFNVGTWVIV